MQLLIVRHGEAEMHAVSDAARNLTLRGRDATTTLAQALIKKAIAPTQIWASPLVRAQQTAHILQNVLRLQLGFAHDVQQCPAIVPEGNVRQCVELLQQCASSECIALVSHQPFVTQLISWLRDATLSPAMDVPVLTTSAAVLLDLPQIEAGCAQLQWALFPPLFK